MFELMYFLFGLALGMVLIGNKDVVHPKRRRRFPMATPDDETQLEGRYKLYWFCERNNETDPKLRAMSLREYARYKTQ